MAADPMTQARRLNREWCDRTLNELGVVIDQVKALIRSHAGCVPAGLQSARLGLVGTRTSLKHQMQKQGWDPDSGEWNASGAV